MQKVFFVNHVKKYLVAVCKENFGGTHVGFEVNVHHTRFYVTVYNPSFNAYDFVRLEKMLNKLQNGRYFLLFQFITWRFDGNANALRLTFKQPQD